MLTFCQMWYWPFPRFWTVGQTKRDITFSSEKLWCAFCDILQTKMIAQEKSTKTVIFHCGLKYYICCNTAKAEIYTYFSWTSIVLNDAKTEKMHLILHLVFFYSTQHPAELLSHIWTGLQGSVLFTFFFHNLHAQARDASICCIGTGVDTDLIKWIGCLADARSTNGYGRIHIKYS